MATAAKQEPLQTSRAPSSASSRQAAKFGRKKARRRGSLAACDAAPTASVPAEQRASAPPAVSHRCDGRPTPSGTAPPISAAPLRVKSAKRRAAEALLASRYGAAPAKATEPPRTPSPDTSGGEPPAKRLRAADDADAEGVEAEAAPAALRQAPAAARANHVAVPGCGCCDSGAGPHGGAVVLIQRARKAGPPTSGSAATASAGWCSEPVAVPQLGDWTALSAALRGCLAGGYGAVVDRVLQVQPGLQLLVAETEAAVSMGVDAMRAAMQDRVVGIDLEWKPDLRAQGPRSPVALMQLATTGFCMLVRCSSMRFRMPRCLRDFLRDESLLFVGFSWDSADEAKMADTFGLPRDDAFGRFIDLQRVAGALGYHGVGLARLTRLVLGHALDKNKALSRCNWQARELTPRQLTYAALDALVTGHLFRGLRLWHAAPSDCAGCRQPLGAHLVPGRLACPVAGCRAKAFDSLVRWSGHMSSCHNDRYCQECGRMRVGAEPAQVHAVPGMCVHLSL